MPWIDPALTLAAYLIGSIPFGVLVGYAFTGGDIRAGGSGHSGGTNVIRQAGWTAGAIAIALDVGKGALALWLARSYSTSPFTSAFVAAAVVAGHCWPILAGWRGGMGLAPAGGALLAVFPLGFAAGLGLLIAAAFALRHSARSAFTAALLNIPLAWALGQSGEITAIAAGVGLVIAVRALSGWNRKQRAVWAVRKTEDREA
jgi:glycerol-3-phosphate acyltransferase PlsY